MVNLKPRCILKNFFILKEYSSTYQINLQLVNTSDSNNAFLIYYSNERYKKIIIKNSRIKVMTWNPLTKSWYIS